MPDEPTKSDATDDTPATSVDVSALVEGFKEVVGEVKTLAETVARPAAAPPTDDRAARLKAAQDEYAAKREKANELAAAGDYAGATEEIATGIAALQAVSAVPATDQPAMRALVSQTKRLARAEHKDMFDSYGSEIETAIAALPVEEQINPDAWDRAVRDVKSTHIDDILAARAAAKDKELEEASAGRTFTTPVARGGRLPRALNDDGDVNADSLTADQLQMAADIGFTPERYAKAVTRHNKHRIRGSVVRILDEDAEPTIAPGKF